MKHILIVTYYFPPYNIIASYRPYHWANFLSQHYKVTVITRSWSGNENGMADIAIENANESTCFINDNLSVISLPYRKYGNFKTAENFIDKVKLRYRHLFGNFLDIEFIEENFLSSISTFISKNKPDLVLYTCNPYQFLPIAKKVFKLTNVKYCIDFRDLFNWSVLRKQPTFKQWLYKKIILSRTKKWLNNASAVFTVSEPIKNILKSVYSKNINVIYNGYDAIQFQQLNSIKQNNKIFTISYIGNINPELNVDVFLQGLNLFFENVKPAACMQFIGVSKLQQSLLIPKLQNINHSFCDWMPHAEAQNKAKESSLLVYMGWSDFTGILSGKIFDYIGAQRKILLAPNDNDVIESLLNKTKAGIVANTPNEVCEIITHLYTEWQNNGFVKVDSSFDTINEYSRQQQALNLKKILDNLV